MVETRPTRRWSKALKSAADRAPHSFVTRHDSMRGSVRGAVRKASLRNEPMFACDVRGAVREGRVHRATPGHAGGDGKRASHPGREEQSRRHHTAWNLTGRRSWWQHQRGTGACGVRLASAGGKEHKPGAHSDVCRGTCREGADTVRRRRPARQGWRESVSGDCIGRV